MSSTMTFSAVGDCFITRNLPENDPDFPLVYDLIMKAEARFANLEITLHNGDAHPSAVCGGTWAGAPPTVLNSMKKYGFNLLSWANNHTLDYLYRSLDITEASLNEAGFVHAGAGQNLASASAPRYLDSVSGRVALIAATTTAHPTWIAGDQRKDSLGRPGVNLLRYEQTFVVTPQHLKALQEIADATGMNLQTIMDIRNGFAIDSQPDAFMFGDYHFIEGEKATVKTRANKGDMARLLDAVGEARRKADYVLVSLHSHQGIYDRIDVPAEFIEEYSRACIDAGAHAVIGHGPHVLRGIEIYKDCPIFYSLGDFIFQVETVTSQPADAYSKFGLSQDHNVADVLDAMSDCYTRGHTTMPEIWEAVMPVWTMKDGKLDEITLYPLELGFELPIHTRGWPKLSKNTAILERLQELSAPYGTKIEISATQGVIRKAE